MAGAGRKDSLRELLWVHGALLTLRGAGGALAALAFAPALVLALPLEPALALGFGFAGLALLKEPVAAPPPAEWPAERLLEKGQMLMLISSAFPLTLLTRRSTFLRSLASPPPALKMSFHLNVTAGRSGVGAMPDSASGCAAASPSASGSGSAAESAPSAAPSGAASPSGAAAWKLWSGSTTPPEKSSSAVSRAGAGNADGFLPTIQNSNSGDAVGDGDDLPDSAPLSGGGGSASTASAIAASFSNNSAAPPACQQLYLEAAAWIWEPQPAEAVAAVAASGNGEWISGS